MNIWIYLLISLLPFTSAVAQTQLSDTTVDEIVNEALTTFHVPGVAIGIVIDNEVVLLRGYGTRNINQDSPVTENTLFTIASCTKAFTSFLLGQLVDEGKIHWDDPVINYIPEFRLYSDELTQQVTLRDLVAHRVGIVRHDALWVTTKLEKSEILRVLPFFEPSWGLREKFQYNNYMYAIAGLVIEKVTGLSWEQAIESKIFSPLGMKNSNASSEEMCKNCDHSLPHADMYGTVSVIPFRSFEALAPAGGISSNVSDLVKWIQLQLSDADHSLISLKTLKDSHTIQMAISPDKNISSNMLGYGMSGYGLGWLIGSYRGEQSVSHSGDLDGFSSDVFLLPERKIGIVILTNSSSDGRHLITAVRNTILDKLLNLGVVNWVDLELENQAKAKRLLFPEIVTTALTKPLEEFLGHFENPAYGVVEISVKDNQLFMSYGNTSNLLWHTSDAHFTAKVPNQLLPYGICPNIPFVFIGDELHITFEPYRFVKPIIFKRISEKSEDGAPSKLPRLIASRRPLP